MITIAHTLGPANNSGPVQPGTEVVLFCSGHNYEYQPDIAAAVATGAAIFEELS